jgi:hypothetical protein
LSRKKYIIFEKFGLNACNFLTGHYWLRVIKMYFSGKVGGHEENRCRNDSTHPGKRDKRLLPVIFLQKTRKIFFKIYQEKPKHQ